MKIAASNSPYSPSPSIYYYGDVRAGRSGHPSWKTIKVFLQRSVLRILGISVDEVKGQHITNEIVSKKLFDIPNVKKQIATGQLTFIGKVARNFDDHLNTKLITAWWSHKRQRGYLLNTSKKSIVQNICIIIPGLGKTGVLKTWVHFALDDRYWYDDAEVLNYRFLACVQ